MKVILFICFSLLVSLFHIATMPIHANGDPKIATHTESAEHHSTHQHHNMMGSEHHQSEDHCPHNNDSCCLTLTIPFDTLQSIQLSVSEDLYPSPTLSIPKLILTKLYRPPKFSA